MFSAKEKDYRIEVGITRGEFRFTKPLKDVCRTFDLYSISKERELRTIFRVCIHLDFRQAKDLLLQHLRARIDAPCVMIEMPQMWTMRKPGQICTALDSIKATTLDLHIYRAYGEMCLVASVDDAAKSYSLQSRATKGRKDAYMLVLKDCAIKNAGGVAQRQRKEFMNRYKSSYDAGKKWHEMSELFGGCGVVLVFLCAGESS